jgi:hypothetical protein
MIKNKIVENIQFHIKPLQNSQEKQIIQLQCNSDGQQIVEIQAYRTLLSYLDRFAGKGKLLDVFMLYELQSGFFWCNYSRIEEVIYFEQNIGSCLKMLGYSKDDDAVYTQDDINKRLKSTLSRFTYFSRGKIVEFILGGLFDLYINETEERYETFEQAYKNLIKTIIKKVEIQETPDKLNDYKIVSLKILGRNFFHPPKPWCSSKPGNIIEVKLKNAKWYIEIEGVKNQLVTVVLSDDYEILDVNDCKIQGE